MVEGLDPRRFGGCSGCGDGATAKPCFGLRGNGTARGRVAQRRSPTGISQESWRWGLRRGEADDGDGDGRRGPRGAATLPSSNDVPWMSPSCCEHLEGWTLADSESAAGGSSFSPLTTEERLQRWLPRFLRLRERKSCSGSFLVVSITCCEHLNG
jgi:hypothetical protein